jgi:integrase
MAPDVATALASLGQRAEWTGDDDLVFVGPAGTFLDGRALRRRYITAMKSAGLRPPRFHDLRHTFGTHIAASGDVSLRTLQEWMGHRDARTTLIYADYQPGEREAELVSKAFSDSHAGP